MKEGVGAWLPKYVWLLDGVRIKPGLGDTSLGEAKVGSDAAEHTPNVMQPANQRGTGRRRRPASLATELADRERQTDPTKRWRWETRCRYGASERR